MMKWLMPGLPGIGAAQVANRWIFDGGCTRRESRNTLSLGLLLEAREFSGRSRTFESETRQPLRLFRLVDGMATINAPS